MPGILEPLHKLHVEYSTLFSGNLFDCSFSCTLLLFNSSDYTKYYCPRISKDVGILEHRNFSVGAK